MTTSRFPLSPTLCLLLATACADEGAHDLTIDESSSTTAASDSGGSQSELDATASDASDESGPSVDDEGDTTGSPGPECGNGIREAGEICDDGELNGQPDYCPESCTWPMVRCGDGLTQGSEACDDGNDVDGDGCNRDCSVSGSLRWEQQIGVNGTLASVVTGPNDELYVAGNAEVVAPFGWGARIDPANGSTLWDVEIANADPGPASRLLGVEVFDVNTIAFLGRRDGSGIMVRADPSGKEAEPLTLAGGPIDRALALPDGDYIVKQAGSTQRLNDDFSVARWQVPTGPGLAHREGDDYGLTAAGWGVAGFQVFGFDGSMPQTHAFLLPLEVYAATQQVAWTSNGDVVMAGLVTGADAAEIFVARSSVAGSFQWAYGPTDLRNRVRIANCVAVDADDFIVVGGVDITKEVSRAVVMKFSPQGELAWTQDLDFDAVNTTVRGCTTDSSGDITVVGDASNRWWMARLAP